MLTWLMVPKQIPVLAQQVISSSSKLPLVSSFYRIGSLLATTMDDLAYFEASLKPGNCDTDRRSRFRDDFTSFVQQVCSQARFYQDELLLTCAELVLATPIGLLAIEAMIDITKSILELGRSYLPAAIVAVRALERWQKRRPDKLEAVIHKIVPLLSGYLDQEGVYNEEPPIAKTAATSAVKNSDPSKVSDLVQLQRRIMLILGKCSGKVSLLMSEPPSIVNASGSMGSVSSPFFRLELQLSEVPLSLTMDPILSHLGELAAHSSVRSVKVNASEGYHALVCYLCGKTAMHPHTAGKKTVFYDMWCGVFATVVRLATDQEKVCRSLFQPLLFQLLRWLSVNSDTFPFEYASLLDELTRSLSDSETAVRTMSARCVASLLSIALECGVTAREKVDNIFERIFSLCRHPGAVQRSGAAASISYFLRSLNEENGAVLTRFALPCLKNLLFALRLCDSDVRSKTGGVDISRDVISKAVLKIERGISRFPQLFLKGSKTHRPATAFEADTILQETTVWLFHQTGAREALFRRLCRRLFVSFSSLISNSSSDWILAYASSNGKGSISAVLAPTRLLAHALPDITMEWMEQLSASIESYVWCVELLGDKAERALNNEAKPEQKKVKRKHTSDTDDTEDRHCQHTLSWTVTNFLKQGDPWTELSTGSQWIQTYLSVLVSLCNCIKSVMNNDSVELRNIVEVENDSFRAGVVEKLLQALLHRPDCWASDASLFDEIEAFCADVAERNQDWAGQVQRTGDTLLQSLVPCLADVNSNETLAKHLSNIQSLVLFGSKVHESICGVASTSKIDLTCFFCPLNCRLSVLESLTLRRQTSTPQRLHLLQAKLSNTAAVHLKSALWWLSL